MSCHDRLAAFELPTLFSRSRKILTCYNAEVDSTTITLDVNSLECKEKAATALAHRRKLLTDGIEAGVDFTSTSMMAQFLRWAKNKKRYFENGGVIRSLEMQWTRVENDEINTDTRSWRCSCTRP